MIRETTVNPLARELNQTIAAANPHVLEMLSTLGREIYFPRGIIAQTAEAKARAKRFNATIGMAIERGGAMSLPSVTAHIGDLAPDEALRYAPVTGLPALREAWKEKNLRDNPSLANRPMSLPIVTNGLTHALSIAADLFCEPGDALVLPDKIWANYRLTFCLRRGAVLHTYPLFRGRGLNADGLRERLISAGREKGKVLTILNFPNNPTGYAPKRAEADSVADALLAAADAGINVVCITDDAYYGLFHEEDVCHESLFARLSGAHRRLLAVKGDAATKELYVWGLRVGFISFGVGGCPTESPLYDALEKKVAGAIRSTISNCSMPSQQIALRALRSPTFDAERRTKAETLKARAHEVKSVLADPKYADAWEPYPFNGGYFMCLRLKKVPAEALRKRLLDEHGVGTIATGERDLRIAFSCVEKEHIRELFDIIHRAVAETARNGYPAGG